VVEKWSLQWAVYSRLSVGEDDRESGQAACGVSPGSRSSSSFSTFSIVPTDGERRTGCDAIGCIYSKIVCNLIPKWLPLWCSVFSFKLLLVASFLNLRFKYFPLNESTRANLEANKMILKWRPFGIKIYTGYIVEIDMIHALCYCTTQLRHSASPSPYIWCWLRIPPRRKTQSFIFVVAVSFFNRIPNWTRILMMTVNQTTGQQQVTSARQALLTPDQE